VLEEVLINKIKIGPLVKCCLNASKKTEKNVFIYAIEKNHNAIEM
jgi:hypothetical protein